MRANNLPFFAKRHENRNGGGTFFGIGGGTFFGIGGGIIIGKQERRTAAAVFSLFFTSAAVAVWWLWLRSCASASASVAVLRSLLSALRSCGVLRRWLCLWHICGGGGGTPHGGSRPARRGVFFVFENKILKLECGMLFRNILIKHIKKQLAKMLHAPLPAEK